MTVHFLSFLGDSVYKTTTYVVQDQPPVTSRFVQVALARYAQSQVGQGDLFRATILVTPKAKVSNWSPPGGMRVCQPGEAPVPYPGLEADLREDGIDAQPRDIPNGNNTQEIWEIFQRIIDVVEPGERLFIDVTHGFRSLPVLLTKALDYLVQIKGVTVDRLDYGMFDPKRQVQETVDLGGFLVVDEWARAVASFHQGGDLLSLGAASERLIAPLRRRLRQDLPSGLRHFPAHLRRLGAVLEHSELHAILPAASDVLTDLRSLEDDTAGFPELTVLRPVLALLRGDIAPLAEDEQGHPFQDAAGRIRGQIAAVRYYFKRSRFLNGYAALRETLADIFVENGRALGLPALKRTETADDTLSALLPMRKNSQTGVLEEVRREVGPYGEALRRQPWVTPELRTLCDSITQRRNQFLHCATANDKLPSPDKLKRAADEHLVTLEQLLPALLAPLTAPIDQ